MLSFVVVYAPGRGLSDVLQFSDPKRALRVHVDLQRDIMNAGGRGGGEQVFLFYSESLQALSQTHNLYFTRWVDGSPVDVEKLAASLAAERHFDEKVLPGDIFYMGVADNE
jgi:hypothetical protein